MKRIWSVALLMMGISVITAALLNAPSAAAIHASFTTDSAEIKFFSCATLKISKKMPSFENAVGLYAAKT